MKLNIQLFAETSVDTEVLKDCATRLKSVAESLTTNFNELADNLLQIDTIEAWSSTGSQEFKTAIESVKPDFAEIEEALVNLSNNLLNISETYVKVDANISAELTGWAQTLIGAIQKIKGGVNSTVGKGEYAAKDFISDTANSAITIGTTVSQATRTIVDEVATIAQNTGNFYTSMTGKTVMQSVQEVTEAAVGSIGTLFSSIGSGSFSSIGTSFVSSLLGLLG